MKEFVCKKDFYFNGELFSKVGDYVLLLQDNTTVVNSNNGQKVINYPDIIKDYEYFISTFETNFPEKFDENQGSSYIPTIVKTPKQEDNKHLHDRVNHPKWYTQHPSGVECIDITRHYCFAIGNAIKYLWRAGLKNEASMNDKEKEIEDLRKAIFYIKDRIAQIEGKYNKNE